MDSTYIMDSLPGTFLIYGTDEGSFPDNEHAATESTCSRGYFLSDAILKRLLVLLLLEGLRA